MSVIILSLSLPDDTDLLKNRLELVIRRRSMSMRYRLVFQPFPLFTIISLRCRGEISVQQKGHAAQRASISHHRWRSGRLGFRTHGAVAAASLDAHRKRYVQLRRYEDTLLHGSRDLQPQESPLAGRLCTNTRRLQLLRRCVPLCSGKSRRNG